MRDNVRTIYLMLIIVGVLIVVNVGLIYIKNQKSKELLSKAQQNTAEPSNSPRQKDNNLNEAPASSPSNDVWYLYKNNDGDKSFSFFYPATCEVVEEENNNEKVMNIFTNVNGQKVKLMSLQYVISGESKKGTQSATDKTYWMTTIRSDKKQAYIQSQVLSPYFNENSKFSSITKRISYSVQTF